MQFNKFTARLVVVVFAGAGLIVGLNLGTGSAQADTSCRVSDGREVQRVQGNSGCGARAGENSTSIADENSGRGTAVSVSDNGGTAIAVNQAPNSSALAGANSGGTALSLTTGPNAFTTAQALRGSTAIAIGGNNGQAYAGPGAAACAGDFALAYDINSGAGCFKSGGVEFRR